MLVATERVTWADGHQTPGERGQSVVTSHHGTSFIPPLSDLINTIIDGTEAPDCCQLKPDSLSSWPLSDPNPVKHQQISRSQGDSEIRRFHLLGEESREFRK